MKFDLVGRLEQARANVRALQLQLEQANVLLVKWQGIAEYLESLAAEADQTEPDPQGE